MAGIENLSRRSVFGPTLETNLQSFENQIYNQNPQLQRTGVANNYGLTNKQIQDIINYGQGRGSVGDMLKNIFAEDIFNYKTRLEDKYIPDMPQQLQDIYNVYDLNKDDDFKEMGRMFLAGQTGHLLNLPNPVMQEIMQDGGISERTKEVFINKLNESPLPFNIQRTGEDNYRVFEYNKGNEFSNLSLTADLDKGQLGGRLNYREYMPIANNTNLRLGANIDERGRATGDLGVRYQPQRDTFVDAGARFDSRGSPEYRIEFGKRFANGGAVIPDEDDTVAQIIEQLSKHNIKVVDFDEDEDSIKNRLFAMAGENPRGHINPSSWLNPSGELTIYVPKAAKTSPEVYKRFLIEEVKHADQIREAPFKTGIMSLLETGKEKLSEVPSNLLNKLPDFHTDEEIQEYYKHFFDPDWETKRGPNPSWKERSGIAPLLRSFRYNRYQDPHSVEGIHRNEERYLPILEKYGLDNIDIFS